METAAAAQRDFRENVMGIFRFRSWHLSMRWRPPAVSELALRQAEDKRMTIMSEH
jgi:hypothetical protein